MTLLVPTVGLNKFLALGLENVLSGDLTLKLYSNNKTPALGDTAASYTEVAGGGYGSITLSAINWSIAAAIATQAQQIFSFTGATNAPSTIYGYYVVNAANVLMWAERFDNSVVPFIPVNGAQIKITPRFQAA